METSNDISELLNDIYKRGMTDDDIARMKKFGFDDKDIENIYEDIELEKKMNNRIIVNQQEIDMPSLGGMLWILAKLKYPVVNSGFENNIEKAKAKYNMTNEQYEECSRYLSMAKINYESEHGRILPKPYRDFWNKYKGYKINELRKILKEISNE